MGERVSMGYSDGPVDCNPTESISLETLADIRYSRRHALFSAGGAALTATMGGMLLSACGGSGSTVKGLAVSTPGSVQTSSGRMVQIDAEAFGFAGVSNGSWTQVSGPTVSFEQNDRFRARFLAPSVAAATDVVVRFTATDLKGVPYTSETTVRVSPATLSFAAVGKSLADRVIVPEGYSVTVLYRLGDPLDSGTTAYANNGTDTGFARRAGDHHDALYYYGLAATGSARDDANSSRGLLVMNHENITQRYLHSGGATTTGGVRPEAEAIKEIEAHGVSIVEVARGTTGSWAYVQSSSFNRRITPNTTMNINGPARGTSFMVTRFSPTGVQSRGTINNCANGYTPWATNLTCEENWAGYFRRSSTDNASRTARDVTSMNRYGLSQGASGSYGWATVSAADSTSTVFSRWNASAVAGQPANGSGDFRNDPNTFGWVVEIDPYDPASAPRKRTALGRMNHEGCWPGLFVAGRRPAFYMGDDARREYIYKFVSATPWVAADASATDRLAIGDKYLDSGTLYVARFDANGTGVWLPLTFGTGPLTPANTTYAFQSQADVLVNARLAADALGATPMDRPEWTAVNPRTGEIYCTLTNNNATLRPLAGTDAANPRHYNDPRTSGTAQRGNPNGHIVRMREAGDSTEATTFTWDIYLFGAGADLDAANINLSGLDATNDFSSPDGLWFGRPSNASGLNTPLLWIQTDDGAYTDVTNCMMLAAIPGTVGDGAMRTITNTDATGATRQQATIVGRAPGVSLKRFLVGPVECEVTGVDSTPDGRTLFVNIQHPGEDTATGFPTSFPSNWPASQTSSTAVSRPRSATIVITRDDGGVVGL